LVDLDLEFGDVAICLKLAPSRNIADAVALDLDDDAAVAALLTAHPASGIDCVLAPINPGDAERVSAATVGQLLDRLRQRYDYVVVDTPSQFSEQVLEAFDRATHHVVVTTPEIPALKNTRLTLDMLDLLGYGNAHRSLVVNRADAKVGLGVADVESALRSTVAVELPATPAVPQSVNRGIPVLAHEPASPFSLAVGEFAARTITGQPAPARARRRGLGLRRRSA
jgi:pilus assembly protein CpaE